MCGARLAIFGTKPNVLHAADKHPNQVSLQDEVASSSFLSNLCSNTSCSFICVKSRGLDKVLFVCGVTG